MKIISHRGNLEGKNPNLENTKHYIDSALNEGLMWKLICGKQTEITIWDMTIQKIS